MTPQTRAWLNQPALSRLWDLLAARLESNGLAIRGRISIPGVSLAEREALSLLLGRAYASANVSVPLSDIDAQLRAGAVAAGLIEVVQELRGPLTSRPALRHAREADREAIWEAAEDALRRNGIADGEWARQWLAEVRRGGSLARLGSERAVKLITQAVHVLGTLNVGGGPGTPPSTARGRGELAERITGTAHGLDDDTLLSRLVLRALARANGQTPPANAQTRRELWQSFGVVTDQVSSTVLTYGLTPLGNAWPSRMLAERSRAHAETHLTARDLRRLVWRLPPGTEVFVCENPRVVETAADSCCSRPLVCTSGNPTTVVLELLDALTHAGATLAYRGDFDWPGIAIANRIIERYGARPWRMSTTDYESYVATARDRGTPLQLLTGPPVEAAWDPELTAAMIAIGTAVQEESSLEVIIADLHPAGQ